MSNNQKQNFVKNHYVREDLAIYEIIYSQVLTQVIFRAMLIRFLSRGKDGCTHEYTNTDQGVFLH